MTTKLTNISPASIRLDTSRYTNYAYDTKPKLSFWQKVGRGLGKAVSFLGPVGAAVMSVIPGLQAPALALYGASRVSGDLTQNALNNDAARMAEYNAEQAGKTLTLPGFFDESSSSADIQTDFIAPSEYGPSIQRTLDDRDASIYGQFNDY